MSSDENGSGDDAGKNGSSKGLWGAFTVGFKRAPRPTVPFLLLSLPVVAIINLIAYLNENERQLPLLVAFGLLAAILIALVVITVRDQKDLHQKQQVVYHRVIPGTLDDGTRPELQRQLNNIDQSALKHVRGAGIKAADSQVRSNVFLPTTSSADEGEIVSLEMVLDVNIPRTTLEHGLQFFVNQGVTGKVFTDGVAVAAFRKSATPTAVVWSLIELPKGTPVADAESATTDEQHLKLVDPALQWIVSFPLKIKTGDSLVAMGVLNVDGLFTITDDLAKSLYARLLPAVEAFAERLAKAPNKLFVKIVVEKFIDE